MMGHSGFRPRRSITERTKTFSVYTDEVLQVFKRLCEEFGFTEELTVVLKSDEVSIKNDTKLFLLVNIYIISTYQTSN